MLSEIAMLRNRRQHLLLLCIITGLLCYILVVSQDQKWLLKVKVVEVYDEAEFNAYTATYPRLNEPVDATWQPVSGARNKFFVYSAFFEGRSEQQRSVRVIGAASLKQKPAEPAWCVMQFAAHSLAIAVVANIKVIHEHHGLRYSACYVMCPLGEHQQPPVSVSVVSDPRSPPSNHLLVIDNVSGKETRRGNLAVCVKPIYNYDQVLHLLEFIELYSLLGVDHFTFYRHNVSSHIDCMVESYVERGAATWLGWKLDLQSRVEIWTEGMLAAFNDCLYRNMYRYDNVAMVDLDEFIFPRKEDDLVQMIRKLDKKYAYKKTGSYVFKNAFFYQTWPSVSSDDPLTSRLLTLAKTRRKSKLLPHRLRTKYICKPELTVQAGNHYVWEYNVVKNITGVNIKQDVAMSQHYRADCEVKNPGCLNDTSVVDDTALKYSSKLLERVKTELAFLESQCGVAIVEVAGSEA